MKTSELQEKLYNEFLDWFTPKYLNWEKETYDKMKNQVREAMGCANPDKELKKLDDQYTLKKIEFITNCQNSYYNVIFDKYNDKVIGKRAMKTFCKELSLSIDETEKMIERLKKTCK